MTSFVKKYVPYGTWMIENLDSTILLGIIALIPFSIRHVFETTLNFKTGAYSDFTSISLYLSDFLIFWVIFRNYKRFKASAWSRLIGLTLIWLAIELLFHRFPPLETYFSLRIVALVFLAFAISITPLDKAKIALITWFFVVLGAIQSIVAFIQFMGQKSIGLYFLGESHLSPDLYGVAKIVAHGTKLIRGYGTFPHSNLLAGFLVISTLLSLYLLTLTYQRYTKVIIALLFALNFTGIMLSFSRGGIIAVLSGILLMTLASLVSKQYKLCLAVALLTIIVGSVSVLTLKPYLLTRSTISDQAVKERLFYNKIGAEIIKDKPVIGTGPGLSVLHMEQYSPTKLETWEIQPVHNYYLIAFAEWGIGALILLAVILLPILRLTKKAWLSIKRHQPDYWRIILVIIGFSCLILFFLDHYFYTIWSTQLLLWVFLGLIAAQVNKTGE